MGDCKRMPINETIGILKLPQDKINRQLYAMIQKIAASEGVDITSLEDNLEALELRVKALEDAK